MLLGLSFIYINEKTPYFPGLMGLLPCLGAAFIIYFNKSTHYTYRLLQQPLLVYIGKISYSLYLWHWVFLSLGKYLYGTSLLPWEWIAGIVLITFILAHLSYTFIEKPIRKKPLSFFKSLIFIYVLPAILLIWWAHFLLKNVVNPKALPNIITSFIIKTNICGENKLTPLHIQGDTAQKPTILMFGDSHAGQYTAFIDYIGKKEGWAGVNISASSCFPIPNLASNTMERKGSKILLDFLEREMPNYPILFVAAHWILHLGLYGKDMEYYKADPQFTEKLYHFLKNLAKEHEIYVFADNPILNHSLISAYHFKQWLPFYTMGSGLQTDPRVEKANQIIKKITDSLQLHWVDINPYIPPNFKWEGKPLYHDKNHFNTFGSELIGHLFIKRAHLLGNK